MAKTILGIVGPQASGKDVVADYFCAKYNFEKIVLSGMLVEYIKENNLGTPDRDLLQEVGNRLRKERGPDYLVRRAMKAGGDKIMISGVRNIIEAKTLIESNGILISCNAPVEERYNRIVSRKSAKDFISFEKFKDQEEFEKNTKDKHAMNIPGVMKMAKHHILNDGTLAELNKKIEDLVKEIGVK